VANGEDEKTIVPQAGFAGKRRQGVCQAHGWFDPGYLFAARTVSLWFEKERTRMNVEMMLKVADYIEQHPEQYNQSEWCGTECCIAGHALALHYCRNAVPRWDNMAGAVALAFRRQHNPDTSA
jgi:hypothetical protein